MNQRRTQGRGKRREDERKKERERNGNAPRKLLGGGAALDLLFKQPEIPGVTQAFGGPLCAGGSKRLGLCV